MTEVVEPNIPSVAPLLGDVGGSASPPPSGEPSPTPAADPSMGSTSPERPQWLPEKFNDPADLAKSYTELERKLADRAVPQGDYEVNVPEGMEIPETYWTEFKDSGLSNAQAQAMVDFYAKTVAPQFVQVSQELELTKLAGELGLPTPAEAQAEATKILNWAKGQPDGDALIQKHGSTASGVLYLKSHLESKLEADRMTEFGGGSAPAAGIGYSKTDIERMVMDERYGVDAVYSKDVNDKLQKQIAREEALASG